MATFDVVLQFHGQGTGLPSMAGEVRVKPGGGANLQGAYRQLPLSRLAGTLVRRVEGNKAALHWRPDVTFTQNGRTESFDGFDFLTFRDGKIIELRQGSDTAKIRAMLTA
jgi:SnoaL-like domain